MIDLGGSNIERSSETASEAGTSMIDRSAGVPQVTASKQETASMQHQLGWLMREEADVALTVQSTEEADVASNASE